MRGSHVLEAIVEDRISSLNGLERAGRKAKERYLDCDTEIRDGETWKEIVGIAKEQS